MTTCCHCPLFQRVESCILTKFHPVTINWLEAMSIFCLVKGLKLLWEGHKRACGIKCHEEHFRIFQPSIKRFFWKSKNFTMCNDGWIILELLNYSPRNLICYIKKIQTVGFNCTSTVCIGSGTIPILYHQKDWVIRFRKYFLMKFSTVLCWNNGWVGLSEKVQK